MQLKTAHVATIVVGVALIASTGLVMLRNDNKEVSADVPVGTATLAIKSQEAPVGSEISADIIVDTGSNAGNNLTSGVDVVLSYDTSLLEVIDADAATPGTQIVPGKLFELVQANTVDTQLGQISFSAGQQPVGQPVVATSQVLATMRFKAKAAGLSPLRFNYTAGAVDDSNVIQPKTGKDLLHRVQDGIITIN